MSGGQIVREARRRAGISQRELANRLDTSQSVIARWEAGTTSPSFDSVAKAVRACGLVLDVHLTELDEGFGHDWSIAKQNLALTPAQRLANLVAGLAFAEKGRAAIRQAKTGA